MIWESRFVHVKSVGWQETEHAGIGPFQRLVSDNLLQQNCDSCNVYNLPLLKLVTDGTTQGR